MAHNGALFLLLADSRMPTGGHAHSGGLEEAVGSGRVTDAPELFAFLRGRLWSSGLVDASFAAASTGSGGDSATWRLLDSEAAARCPSPAQRETARAQGRRLIRLGNRLGQEQRLAALALGAGNRPMWSVALGALAAALGLDPGQAALACASASVSGPAWAAVRTMSLDPFLVARMLADLAPEVEEVSTKAEVTAGEDPRRLPAVGAPLLELGAEDHAGWEVRLFAS
jgi:urease accessory protein